MKVKKLDDKVYYYSDLISNPKDIHDDFANADGWAVRFGNKDDDGNWIPGDSTYIETIELEVNQVNSELFDQMISCVKHYMESHGYGEFDQMYFLPTERVWGVDRHFPGTHLVTHSDTVPEFGKTGFTVLLYVNDDYEGGELSFSIKEGEEDGLLFIGINSEWPASMQDVDFWIKPEACSIVIMPALSPYFHTAHNITSGTKYLVKNFYVTERNE